MKNLLKIVLLAIGLVAILPSCNKGNEQKNAQVNQDSIDKLALNDSLATVRAEKDTLAAIMAEVSDGMNQIMDMQKIMSVENISADSPYKKGQLRNNILAIQKNISAQNQRLAELEKRLQRSTSYSDEMKKQVQSLKKQLENQQNIITNLTTQLEQAHVKIRSLNTTVDSLHTENTKVSNAYRNEQHKAQEETTRANNLMNEMNVCYYVIGSKKELKKQRIIETGFLKKTKVMEGDYTQSYFTKTDKRVLTRLPLHSKSAEVMSKHPRGSYVIEDANGQKVLRITNPARFWELSNYLVVKID